MSEADWWFCTRCSSLNNLSARKCYSCRTRKPRDAVRASEILGYVPVISWDGKVTLMRADATGEAADAVTVPLAGERVVASAPAAASPRPLREPVRRHILAVAPQPPNPARITYRDEFLGPPAAVPPEWATPAAAPPRPEGHGPKPEWASPAPFPPAPAYPGPPPGTGQPATHPRPLVAVGPGQPPVPMGPGQPPVPMGPGRGPVPMGPNLGLAPTGAGPVPVDRPPGGPMQAIEGLASAAHGPVAPDVVPAAPPRPAEEQWPHWRELLDGPTPHADRLRRQSEAEAALAGRVSRPETDWPSRVGPAPAIDVIPAEAPPRAGSVDPSARSVPWPETDRLPQADTQAEEGE